MSKKHSVSSLLVATLFTAGSRGGGECPTFDSGIRPMSIYREA